MKFSCGQFECASIFHFGVHLNFPAWPTGAFSCLSCFGFLGNKIFCLSFTVFGGRIGNLCSFVEGFI